MKNLIGSSDPHVMRAGSGKDKSFAQHKVLPGYTSKNTETNPTDNKGPEESCKKMK